MTNTDRDNLAIITLGGKQHLVKLGAKISVNRLTNVEGETLSTPNLLDQSPVQLKIISHLKGKKINGLKFKNKVRFTRHYGHRQHLTEIEVLSIGGKTPAKVANDPKLEVKTEAKKAKNPSHPRPPAGGKKPVAKKATTAKGKK